MNGSGVQFSRLSQYESRTPSLYEMQQELMVKGTSKPVSKMKYLAE